MTDSLPTEYIDIREFNHNGENGGIESSRSLKGYHTEIRKIESGDERIEGSGKTFVDVTLFDEETGSEFAAGTHVAKEFNTKVQALEEIKKCLYLEKAGIPIPSTHWYVEQDGKYYVIYSDLSEGGKNEVWSQNNLWEDNRYPDLTEEQYQNVEEQVHNISIMAEMYGMNIKADAYFIVTKPDKSVSVVIGDLGKGIGPWPNHDMNNEKFNNIEAEYLLKLVKGIKEFPPDNNLELLPDVFPESD
jgi:hypothetical protein